MTSTITSVDLALLHEAAAAARLAPSIHNSQPWRFRVKGKALELSRDASRQLSVLDPDGRQAMISCGCALLNIRVTLAAAARPHRIVRFPDGLGGDVLARVELTDTPERYADPASAALGPFVEQRRTNRRRFHSGGAPDTLVARLGAAAAAEDSVLFAVRRADQRAELAALTREADAVQNADPAYRAELRSWTTADHDRVDGVPETSVPHVTGGLVDEFPLRDFDTRGSARLAPHIGMDRSHTLLLLGSDTDDRWAWLRSGEALERVLLELTRAGWMSSPINQAVELPQTRSRVRQMFGGTVHPQILLRVGHAEPTPHTSRRPISELLTEDS